MGCYDIKGIGYSTTGEYLDMSSREYLQISRKGFRAIMDPNWSSVNNHLSTFYAVPFFDNKGKQLGELTAVVDATALCNTMTTLTVGKDSHPFVISRKTGKYVAHENQKYVENSINVSDNTSVGFKPVLEKIISGEIVEGSRYTVKYSNDEVFIC